jgi:hypothetical protein
VLWTGQDRLARGEDADWSDEDDDEGFEVQGAEEDDEATMEAEERALGAKLKEEQAAELSDLQAENEMYVGGGGGCRGLPSRAPCPTTHCQNLAPVGSPVPAVTGMPEPLLVCTLLTMCSVFSFVCCWDRVRPRLRLGW